MAKHILVVDDEQDPRSALAQGLRNEGYDVTEASDGEEGLRVAFEIKPDLILLDIVMPKVNGLYMLERLRADDWGKDALVIMLTVREEMEGLSKAMELGSLDYLIKTAWKLEEIVAKVKEKIGEPV